MSWMIDHQDPARQEMVKHAQKLGIAPSNSILCRIASLSYA